jgi:hypothetical protein
MPSVTRLAQDVAAKIWPVATTRSWQGWQWLRRNHRPAVWVMSLTLTVFLLVLLLAGGASWIWGKYHANREDLTPIATLVGGGFAAWVALRQVRIAADRHAAQTDADRQRRITESFSTAIEQLGSDKIEVRLGGIYTLERVSRESPNRYWPVMETLTAFVREQARWKDSGASETIAPFYEEQETDTPRPRQRLQTDIAAVLTVIARRREKERIREKEEGWQFDLSGAVLPGARLQGAHLEHANLSGAHLEGAMLAGTYLAGANLQHVHLEGGGLREAHLEGADLIGAHLEGASLRAADLQGADLTMAHLEGANLRGADLREADLESADLNGAIGDAATRLPDGFPRPAHWPPYESDHG